MVFNGFQELITLVNLVRRKEQAQILEALGEKHIVDTSEKDWEARLSELIRHLQRLDLGRRGS